MFTCFIPRITHKNIDGRGVTGRNQKFTTKKGAWRYSTSSLHFHGVSHTMSYYT
ncbi:Uncharacterised protein [Mycobacteroides abscessus subsp. massiliense]|nr:Uncharacterised protein [Mycobacteroides abscessus subsp. massiliense]